MILHTSLFTNFLFIKVGLTFYILDWSFAVRKLTMMMLIDGITFSVLLGILFVAVPYITWNSYVKGLSCLMVIFGHQCPFWRHLYNDYHSRSDDPEITSLYISTLFTFVVMVFSYFNKTSRDRSRS